MSPKLIIAMGEHFVSTRSTVRKTAQKFGISKTTVHYALTTKLYKIHPQLAQQVEEVMDANKRERYRRGGIAAQKLLAERKKLTKRKK